MFRVSGFLGNTVEETISFWGAGAAIVLQPSVFGIIPRMNIPAVAHGKALDIKVTRNNGDLLVASHGGYNSISHFVRAEPREKSVEQSIYGSMSINTRIILFIE
ncbi:hypothetical protein ANTPLA_LOCUS8307 [Anthophora plagiata]